MSVIKTTLHDALIVLTSHEDAKSRLARAWVNGLEKVAVEELPDGIRERFLAMRDRLTSRRPVNNEHPIIATIRKMSPMEAARYSHDIVQMYAQVMTADEPVQLRLVDRSDVEEVADGESLPDFLSRH